MKIEVGQINISNSVRQVVFTPETPEDYFWMGVITTENKAYVKWLDEKPDVDENELSF